MPNEIVSPAYHFCISGRLYALRFHSVDGSSPVTSPSMSMPVLRPKPNGDNCSYIRSTPISLASE
ncbi:MAG: hypothetical protein LKCHEGNO_03333 [Burkholderiaceae bacterium]|nr:hypothetical protein [Burkholderiaceae bacterium]